MMDWEKPELYGKDPKAYAYDDFEFQIVYIQ